MEHLDHFSICWECRHPNWRANSIILSEVVGLNHQPVASSKPWQLWLAVKTYGDDWGCPTKHVGGTLRIGFLEWSREICAGVSWGFFFLMIRHSSIFLYSVLLTGLDVNEEQQAGWKAWRSRFSVGCPHHVGSMLYLSPAIWVCLKMLCTPKNPMVSDHEIPMKNGYFIGNIPYFQTYPFPKKSIWLNVPFAPRIVVLSNYCVFYWCFKWL